MNIEKLAEAMHDAAIRYANGHTVDFQHEAREFMLERASQPEQYAWEATTPVYTKYITDERYQKFSPAVQKWYRPICQKCASQPGSGEAEPRAWLVEWKCDADIWVQAHASEVPAVDQARKNGGICTPLYARAALADSGEADVVTVPRVPTDAMVEAWNNSGADDFKIKDPNYSEFTDEEWEEWKKRNATRDWDAMVRAALAGKEE